MDVRESEMKCKNHPDREAIGVCQKHEAGFCRECCECLNIDHCCECIDPKLYCKFRTQCLIWEMSRDRRKNDAETSQLRNSECGMRSTESEKIDSETG